MSNYKNIEKITKKLGLLAPSKADTNYTLPSYAEVEIKYLLRNKKEVVSDMITSRMDEVKRMCYRRQFVDINITELPQHLQDYIEELKNIPSHTYRENTKKKFKSKIDLFRNVARIVITMIKSLLRKRRYFLDKWLENFADEPGTNDIDIEKMRIVSLQQFHTGKSALTSDALMALNTVIGLRDDHTIKKIMWVLQRLNAFDLIVPHDMLYQLAERVTYERYENGRIIAHENKVAKRLYYILSGKIKLLKKFDLSGGDLYKIFGYLNKGESTDPEEVERCWIRQHTLVAKGVVEVLTIERKDLFILRHHYHNLPLDFLKSIDLFSTYPFENLIKNNETIMYQYYGPNQIITKDADESPWLYVVKSGNIKIVKKMKVIDVGKQIKNPSFFLLKPNVTPKTAHPISFNSQNAEIFENPAQNEAYSTLRNDMKRTKSVIIRPPVNSLVREATLPPIKLMNNKIEQLDENMDEEFVPNQLITPKNSLPMSSKPLYLRSRHNTISSGNTNRKPLITASASAFKTSGDSTLYKTSHVIIDYLEKGSVFGLNAINDARKNIKKFRRERDVRNENEKIILISEGTELILLSKRNFVSYADVDTLCKIEKMVHPYMGEDEAQKLLLQAEKWKAYKKNLLNTLVTHSVDVL